MRTIHKFELQITDLQTVDVKGIEKILKVAEQNGKLFLWCVVDTEVDLVSTLELRIFGTGYKIDYWRFNEYYFDTVLMSDGLVWHISIEFQ